MKYLSTVIASLSMLAIVAPGLVQADVVTQEMLDKIADDPGNHGAIACVLSKSIVAGQESSAYGQAASVPVWKTLTLKSGVSISFPWSPYWYVVGKQIPWYEYDASEEAGAASQYLFGRYQSGNACGLSREYYVNIYPGETLVKHFANTSKQENGDVTTLETGSIVENFTLNGKPAALVRGTNSFCDQDAIAIQITKKKKPYTLVFAHSCGNLNNEIMRMAARVQ